MNKGALSLLADYGSDDSDSDNEVPFGKVSTKRLNNINENPSPIAKRLCVDRLPVPQILIESKQNEEDIPSNDPSMHTGRIRSFPHERGNWATYVYIPYESPDFSLADVITVIIHSLPHLKLEPVNDFHISLTRTVVLKYHWIEPFIQSVREKVSFIKKFVTVFNSLNVYCNEERTRTFIGLQVQSGFDTLLKLVEHLDGCLNEFKLPEFYKNPSFHMSLAWCVGDYVDQLESVLPELNKSMEELLENNSQRLNYVTHLECKCGNKLFTFDLD